MSSSAGALESRTVHFDLSHMPSAADFKVRASLQDAALKVHSLASRRRCRSQCPGLAVVPDQRLTHFAELSLPSDAISLVQVLREEPQADGLAEVPVAFHMHIPAAARRTVRQTPLPAGSDGVAAKVKGLGLDAEAYREATGDDPRLAVALDDWEDARETALTLLFEHPSVLHLDPEIAAYLRDRYLVRARGLDELALAIFSLGEKWTTPKPVLDEEGNPMEDPDEPGETIYAFDIHRDVLAAYGRPADWVMQQIQDDPRLEGQLWNLQYGVTESDYAAAEGAAGLTSGDIDWSSVNKTPGYGLRVSSRLELEPAPRQGEWSGTGVWSLRQAETPLTPEIAEDLLAGRVFVKVVKPSGEARGPLVPARIDPEDEVEFKADLEDQDGAAAGSGAFNLNLSRSGLSYEVKGSGKADSASFCDAEGQVLHEIEIADISEFSHLTVVCWNDWVRHLGAYVEYLNVSGRRIHPPDWEERLPTWGGIRSTFQPNRYKKFLRLVPPVSLLSGVPLPTRQTEIRIPIPSRAATIRLHWGGAGQAPIDSDVIGPGAALTWAIDFALPIVLAMSGAALGSTRIVQRLLSNHEVLFSVLAVLGGAVTVQASRDVQRTGNIERLTATMINLIGPLLLRTGLAFFIKAKIAEATAKNLIPILNKVFVLHAAVTALAQVNQAVKAIEDSPAVFTLVIQRGIHVQITLHPDSRFHRFPDLAAYYEVRVLYDIGATVGTFREELPGTVVSDPIQVALQSMPAAGRLKVFAGFYAENGWQAGQGETGWMPARGNQGSTLVIENLEITTNEVPLGEHSVYRHRQKLAFQGGRHVWQAALDQPPRATARTPAADPGHELIDFPSLTMSQSPAMMGYCWHASGLGAPTDWPDAPPTRQARYALQNLSTLQRPSDGLATPQVAFRGKAGIVYDLLGPGDGSGLNFFIDPRRGQHHPDTNPQGGFHLRHIELRLNEPPNFDISGERSWGRFRLAHDRFAIHPQGWIFGISFAYNKMEILHLPSEPRPDSEAPFAHRACGRGTRDGLLFNPRAIAVTLDGRVLVLESENRRIQAFDIHGNPVKDFGPQDDLRATMPLKEDPEGVHYLDMAVEPAGFIYVLAYRGDGRQPEDYHVDLYAPDGDWLVRTPDVAAARIFVSQLRNLYTLNYEVLRGPGGRTEPSISLWIPPPPPVE